MKSWLTRTGKSAFSSNITRVSKSSISKTTALTSYIKFWIDAFILLHESHTDESLVLFLKLAWILPLLSPSTIFFQAWVFFLKSLVVCSICHFCAALTANIAVRPLVVGISSSIRTNMVVTRRRRQQSGRPLSQSEERINNFEKANGTQAAEIGTEATDVKKNVTSSNTAHLIPVDGIQIIMQTPKRIFSTECIAKWMMLLQRSRTL